MHMIGHEDEVMDVQLVPLRVHKQEMEVALVIDVLMKHSLAVVPSC